MITTAKQCSQCANYAPNMGLTQSPHCGATQPPTLTSPDSHCFVNPVTRLTVAKIFWPPTNADHPLPRQTAAGKLAPVGTVVDIVKPLYQGEASLYLVTATIDGWLLSSWLSAEEFE